MDECEDGTIFPDRVTPAADPFKTPISLKRQGYLGDRGKEG